MSRALRHAWRWAVAAALIVLVVQVRSSWAGVILAGFLGGVLLWPVLTAGRAADKGSSADGARVAALGTVSAAVVLLLVLLVR